MTGKGALARRHMENPMDLAHVIAISMGVAWASGINMYAAIAMLGILGATGHMALGYVVLGKLRARTVEELNRRATKLIRRQPRPVRTITVDNGTEFHGYATIEQNTSARFYFATPYHSWERGTNENTNGLLRQYLPKRQSMRNVTQRDCDRIAAILNARPRKRLAYRTPEECYAS